MPEGPAPEALDLPHFPSRLHALVWRNWQVTPVDRIAETVHSLHTRLDKLCQRRRVDLFIKIAVPFQI